MAVQERFTPEEWQEVVAGPVDAGLMIAFTQTARAPAASPTR
jgi:hypothetical protein